MSRHSIGALEGYERALRRRARALRATATLFNGYWLGRLDRAGLARVDEAFYESWTESLHGRAVRYADDAWNTSGLHDWEAAMVADHFPAGGRVVVTAAGAGREVLALAEAGFDAVGFEPNERLVEAGTGLLEARGHHGRLRTAERDRFPPDAGDCDAVVVGWGSYHSIPGRGRRIAFLRDARATLPPGGPILVSFFTRGERDRSLLWIARLANVGRALRRDERCEQGDTLNPNFLHLFARSEVEAEFAEAGFRLVHYEAEPYGHAVGYAA